MYLKQGQLTNYIMNLYRNIIILQRLFSIKKKKEMISNAKLFKILDNTKLNKI